MIETERLWLIPLKPRQLRLWREDIPALERALGCAYQGEPVAGGLGQFIKLQQEKATADPQNYLWHSFWFLVCKEDRVVVGSVGFKNPPNCNKEVEIGYGLGEPFTHRGYMTEAVKAMCAWAMEQEAVSHVIAETELAAFASQRVLGRCGFREERRKETIWWKL